MPVDPSDALLQLPRQTAPFTLLGNGVGGFERGEEEAGHDVTGRVHQDGERRAQPPHQRPGDQRPRRSGDRGRLLGARVRGVEPRLGDEAGHEGLARRVEQQTQDAGREDDHAQGREGQQVEAVQHGYQRQHGAARQVRAHHDGFAPPPVHQEPGHQPEQQIRQPPDGVDDPHLGGAGAQGDGHEDPEGEPGDLGAEGGDGEGGPEAGVSGGVDQSRHDRDVPGRGVSQEPAAPTIRSTAAVTNASRSCSPNTSGRVSCSTISQLSVRIRSLTAVASPGRPEASW